MHHCTLLHRRRVQLQRAIQLMKDHDFFITQVVFPLSINVMCWPAVWLLIRLGKVSAAERATPRWKFAVLALAAGGGNLINAFPQAALPGSIITVLQTLATPILMLLSRLLLGTRYRWPHYLAAALILCAAVLVVAPQLSQAAGLTGMQAMWILVLVGVLFVSGGPSGIFTEKWMKDVDMTVW